MKSILLFSILLFLGQSLHSQDCSNINLHLISEITSTCNEIPLTSLPDKNGLPFLYVASKEAGLKIYDISVISDPKLVKTISTSELGNLDVMNLYQQNTILYLSLGNHFTNPQAGGIAIVNIVLPEEASVLDFYIIPNSGSGSGDIFVSGDIAYLAAMRSGLRLYDVSDESSITELSSFLPDSDFPVTNPNLDLYNVRGIEVVGSIAYLCNDAGGFHIVDCSNPLILKSLGKYANPITYEPINRPRAYNNLIIRDSFAFIAVDYCGLEVVNISNPSSPFLYSSWNPQGCPANNWFNTPHHANEMFLNEKCNQLFVSTGKSDMIVLDISNPAAIDSCSFYGGVENGIGTWGISGNDENIFLSYICAFVPFSSNFSGIKILSYEECMPSSISTVEAKISKIFPNPVTHEITISTNLGFGKSVVRIFNSKGQIIRNNIPFIAKNLTINLTNLPPGLYFLEIDHGQSKERYKFIKL